MKNKPIYLDIPKIRLPIPGIVSILHRVTGAALFISLPIVLWLFSGTLNREESFAAFQAFIAHPVIKVILVLALWAYLHHTFAGIRFLFLDIHKGLELQTARTSAKIVAICAVIATLIIGASLW